MFQIKEIPFPYEIKVHKRAKRLNLKVSPHHGVQVTIPPYTSKKEALHFLSQHIDWVQKNKHLWQAYHQEVSVPQQIHLPAYNQVWQIQYETNVLSKSSRLITGAESTLIYHGKDDKELQLKRLRQWVQQKATELLTQRIEYLSKETGLTYKQLNFRSPKTRWGSCSHEKNICLNLKLIFFPLQIIDYVIIHELAHTVHLNHGKKFWALVNIHNPDYKNHIKKLKQTKIPTWF